MTQTGFNDKRIPLILLGFVLLCAAPIIAFPGRIAYWPSALYNDLLISHLPLSQIAHDLIFQWHQLPLWNPFLLSGMPLAADPLAGIAYPPNWLLILWPSVQAANVLFLGHLVWAGMGARLLARAENPGTAGAIAAGLILAGSSKLVTHLSLGHLGLVSAASWTPWVLLGIRKMIQAPAGQAVRTAGIAGLQLGMLFLADPRWLIPSGLLSAAYFIAARNRVNAHLLIHQLLKRGLLFGVFALGLSACLSLPLWELAALSTRTSLSHAEQTIFSLKAIDLLGVFVVLPQQPEQFVYLGGTVVYLSLLAFIRPSRMTWFWGATAVGATLLATGPATPFYAFFSSVVPGGDLLRVPGRFFILTTISVAMLAGKGVELLLIHEDAVFVRRRRILTVAFFLFVIAMNSAVWIVRGLPSTIALAPILAALCALVLLYLGNTWRERGRALLAAWLILIALEAIWVDSSLLEMRPIRDESSSRLADLIAIEPGRERVFSPTFNLSPLVSAQRGIETVQGISPLQLDAYRTYLSSALAFDPSIYSIPLPPMAAELDPTQYDLEKLAKLNVTWILSEQPIERSDLEAKGTLQGVHLYRLASPGSRAEFNAASPTATEGPTLQITGWSPNRITLHTSSGGRLVLAEVDYPGWTARIDHRRTEIQVEEGLFRAIDVPTGEHEIEFTFRPRTVYLGWATTILTLVAMLVMARRR